ncbi:hypothetical protein NA78x_002033 [Anatilimnocola sp. NA78]|uniref:hypothetical protein n=1 Tax=Anatilimnocola sp. NA78 TaxID=3415683 RepID=UPI003CE508C5
MLFSLRSLQIVSLLGCGIGVPLAAAQETTPPTAEQPNTQKAADIGELIKQLDADEFPARQEASQRLAAAGEKAVPELEKATSGESREAAMRAFDILKSHFEKGSPAARDASKAALERLAKADLGSTSRRASEILTPPNPATPNNAPVPGIVGGPIGLRMAVVRAIAGGAGGGVETRVKVENGVKTTEVKDKERQVKIVDDPDKGITMEVTETKDGKEETKKYAAKNADELKTKEPDAHKLFEQYTAKGGAIRFAVAPGFAPAAVPRLAPAIAPPRRVMPAAPPVPGIPIPVPGFPVPAIEIVPAAPLPPALPAKERQEAIDELDKSLQAAEASLKEAFKNAGDDEQAKKAQARLDEVRKQLEKLRESLK